MKVASFLAIVFACTVGFSIQDRAEAKAKWVCTKDGEEIKVKGKKPKDKEKDCTAQGGVWEKAKEAAEDKQESGMGGAW
jgi:hypothetical protein